jgi:hypothetical protein
MGYLRDGFTRDRAKSVTICGGELCGYENNRIPKGDEIYHCKELQLSLCEGCYDYFCYIEDENEAIEAWL